MKSLLVTTPIRPTPSPFPPIGSLSIINYLRKNGAEIDFYHIDALRPSSDEAIQHIINERPAVLGISAVVSTAYEYTKRLVQGVKAALPDTLVIVGGSLAASAEILLRRAGVDLCALGEGEKVMLNVVKRAETTRKAADFADIPGLVLLDDDGNLVNTGYEQQLAADEIYDVSWGDLEQACDISHYIYPAVTDGKMDFWFERDPRSYEPHRLDKNIASLPAAKGCVAKCTFCHRWDKGIRYIPPETISERVRELVGHHNVGFINIVDENFGTDKRWLAEFCKIMKPQDVLWRVAGMRVNCISPEYIDLMKDAGCVAILYGMETGSEKILKVMDKKVKLQDNYDAMRWTVDAGQNTVVQLVIGMPGEDTSTIRETAKFASYANSLAPWQRPWDLSINYAQALPGTPLYEYARRVGLIGSSLEGEEEYLLQISDRDAADERVTLNFTPYPFYVHRAWRNFIQLKAANAYIRRFGKSRYTEMLLADTRYFARSESEDTGYFNKPKLSVDRTLVTDTIHGQQEAVNSAGNKLPSLWSLIKMKKVGLSLICYPEIYGWFAWFMPLLWLVVGIKGRGMKVMLQETWLWMSGELERLRGNPDHSLRKVVFNEIGALPEDAEAMEPLRRGR